MKKVLLTLAILAVPILAWVIPAAAEQAANNLGLQTGDTINISKDQMLDRSLYAAGNNVTVAGTINGDVYCAGRNITISGTVQGDVLCAGQFVTVSGSVQGDVRLAGQIVKIEGSVAGNATLFGQLASLEKTGTVGSDLNGGSSTVTLNGKVGRDITIGGSDITLSGEVGRNVEAATENLNLSDTAVVGGSISYRSDNEASINPNAIVAGDINRSTPTEHDRSGDFGGLFLAGLQAAMMFSLIILALIAVLVFPQLLHRTTEAGIRRPLRVIGFGLLASILTPIILVGLVISLVGWPLALVIGLLWMVVLILTGPLFAYVLGRWILGKQATQPVWTMLLGVVIVSLLYLLPVINVLTGLAATLIGTGVVVNSLVSNYKRPVYKVKA